MEAHDGDNGSETLKNCSVHVSFSTCHEAERAFVNGKCWDGHNLNFAWLMPDNPSNENPSSTIKGPVEADVQTEDKTASNISTEAVASGGEGSGRS